MRVIILAGGLGTRLRHLVPELPKPMASVAGRPFLEYVIEHLVDQGFREIILSVGYRANAIQDHFGSSWATASIAYVEEREPLGTGGAIANATHDMSAEEILVLNGDTLLDLNFGDLIAAHHQQDRNSSISMVLRLVGDSKRYGAVQCDDGTVVGFLEKGTAGPGLINAGAYILATNTFRRFGLTGRFSLESDLLQAHLVQLRPKAFITDGFFIDIGVEEDFKRAQFEVPLHFERTRLARGQPGAPLADSRS